MKDEVRVTAGESSLGSSDLSPSDLGRESAASSFILHPSSFFKWLVRICRFGLAALFLFTAGAKLWILPDFATNVGELISDTGFDHIRWMWPATIAVIAIEIITAGLLLLPRTARLGALSAAALLVGFSAFALYYRYGLGKPEGLECGCFGGIIASQLGVQTALRNLALLLPVILVFVGYRKRPPKTAPDYSPIAS